MKIQFYVRAFFYILSFIEIVAFATEDKIHNGIFAILFYLYAMNMNPNPPRG